MSGNRVLRDRENFSGIQEGKRHSILIRSGKGAGNTKTHLEPGKEVGLPTWLSVNESPVQETGDTGWIPGLERSPGEGHGNPLQHSSHGQRNLVGYSLWGCKESDMAY